MTRPPKPPIVHRLEQRRVARTNGEDVGAMFWVSVFVAVAGVYCLITWGGK